MPVGEYAQPPKYRLWLVAAGRLITLLEACVTGAFHIVLNNPRDAVDRVNGEILVSGFSIFLVSTTTCE